MAKRNPRKKRKKQPAVSKYKLINLVLFMVVITLSITIFAYYVILNQHNQKQTTNIQQQHQNEQEKKNLLPQSKQDIINKYLKQKYENKPLAQTTPKHDQFEEYTEELKKEYIHPPKEPSTFDESSKDKIKKITLEQKAISNKPKLAIIIDDVTLASQVKKNSKYWLYHHHVFYASHIKAQKFCQNCTRLTFLYDTFSTSSTNI
jgi:hypothetical protein